ncbi:putative organic cation transporter protein-like [Apostichopus japonicus]|uniref:Putative organic cation transporter protein-like n=1 Tax=Stichopus japonicus TaxID=307972 RepID=A0A2G8JS19_STIJA|nr:putative organic cation transporter protein-like [Apostichopus japonicus]
MWGPGSKRREILPRMFHALRNASVPYSIDDDNNGELVFEHCSKYDLDYAEFNWTEAYLYEESEEPKERDCDDGWIYDRSQYPRTIISDFNLVCNSEKAADIAQSIFFAGVLAGSFIFGSVSDIVGRYYTYYTAVVLLAVFPLINAFAPSFWLYVLFRFFIAAANMGTFLIAFVIGTELVGPSKRVTANCMIQCTFAVGYMLLAVVAYFVRDWRILQLTIVAPTFLFIFTIPFVTESPRWLISKRRFSDAAKIITKAAKFNKKEDRLPPNFIQEIQKSEELEHDSALKTATFIDLFRTPNLRISTLNCMYNWFINSLVYYGLSLSTSDLGSNIYIAFFISGAVEIPAYIVGIPMMESRLGRRYSTSICEILGGVACLLTIFLPPGGWKTMIAMIGKFGISASFSLIYIYSAEVIPTPLRSVGVGMCSTAARVGGILAPLILLLDDVWEPLPLLIFGFSAVIGGILVLYLPRLEERCYQRR